MKDKETNLALKEGEHLYHLIGSDGWSVASRILQEKEDELKNLASIPMNLSVEDYGFEAKARSYALALIDAWRRDIDVRIERYTTYISTSPETDNGFIVNRDQ